MNPGIARALEILFFVILQDFLGEFCYLNARREMV